MFPKKLFLSAAFALAAWVLPGSAQAAPQILALLATAEPLPMHCADGTCTVEVSAACMQQHRDAPTGGTAYRAAEGAELKLIVHGTDGVIREAQIAERADIVSLRLFTSVAVRLPQGLIEQLGGDGAKAYLEVGPLASAVPVAIDGDPEPLTEVEIANYTGPLRGVAEAVINGFDNGNVTATRALNQMINHLPEGDDSVQAEAITSVRAETIDKWREPPKADAARLIRRAFETCRESLRRETDPNLRACLENQHDNLNTNTTHAVWRSLRQGS